MIDVGPRSHKRFRRSQNTTALFSCPVSRPRARQVATYHVTDHDLLCGGEVTPTYSPSKMRCPPGHCNKLLQRNTSKQEKLLDKSDQIFTVELFLIMSND